MKKNTGYIITTVVFVVFLFGLAIANLIYNPDDFSETENRMLATFPKLTADSLFGEDGDFCEKTEEYINDRFVMRDTFTAINASADYLLNRRDIGGIWVCKDGYYMTKCTPEEVNERTVSSNILGVEKFFENLDGNKYFMLVPSASLIYRDKLPAFANEFDQQTEINNIFAGVTAGKNVDVRDAFFASDEQLYYRTDHHWTSDGAYTAYREFCKTAGLEPLEKSDFEIKTVSTEFQGTHDSKVLLAFAAKDEVKLYIPKQSETLKITHDGKTSDSFYVMSALEKKDKYQVFLGGNYGRVDIETGVKNGKRLLVVKDSFANSFVPLLTTHYEKICMLDLRFFSKNPDDLAALIDEFAPTDTLILFNIANFISDPTIKRLAMFSK